MGLIHTSHHLKPKFDQVQVLTNSHEKQYPSNSPVRIRIQSIYLVSMITLCQISDMLLIVVVYL